MISEQRKQEIIAAFQRSFKRDNSEEIAAIPLAELRAADEMLGNRDVGAGFRLRLQNRIKVLEDASAEKKSSHLRALDYIMGIATGLLIAWASKFFT